MVSNASVGLAADSTTMSAGLAHLMPPPMPTEPAVSALPLVSFSTLQPISAKLAQLTQQTLMTIPSVSAIRVTNRVETCACQCARSMKRSTLRLMLAIVSLGS